MLFPFDLSSILTLILFIAVVVLAAFVWQLHRKGVAGKDIPGQVALRAADFADDFRDEGRERLRDWALKAPGPTLKDAYYDLENFNRDLGRVMATGYAGPMVRLDGAVKVDGDGPPTDFRTLENGNVSRKTP